MILLPFENFEIKTNLFPEAILEKLIMETDVEKFYRAKQSEKFFEGKVCDEGFKIKKIINYRNTSNPIIIGKIIQNNQKTTIKVLMRLSIYHLIATIVFLTSLVLLLIVIINEQLGNKIFDYEPAIIVFLFLLVGYVFIVTSFKFESTKIKAKLINLF